MNKINWKGSALLAPVPTVLVTCKSGDVSNIITIGWTGIVSTVPPRTYISVRPERYSYGLIKESGEFAVNLVTAEMVRAADTLGVFTGRKTDKFKKGHLTAEDATVVSCPLIAESPLSLECRVFDVIPLGSHDMFLADIVCVDVEERLIDKSGRLRLDTAHLAAYSHGEYFELGRKIGAIGYSVAKKKKGSDKGRGNGKRR